MSSECGIGVSVHPTLQIILFTTKDAKASKKIWGEMPGPHTLLVFCFFLVPYRSYRLQAQKDFFTTKEPSLHSGSFAFFVVNAYE
ncbi:MAG: hypothetical protein ACLQJ7_15320 [Syntrophobacteraceae bacterium]